MNKKCDISIKTPVGMTERKKIEEVVMQGGIFGGIQCSLQTDLVGKNSLETGENLYQYKNSVNVPSLAYLDDMAALSNCGIESLKMNIKTSELIKCKKIKLSEKKCHVKREL